MAASAPLSVIVPNYNHSEFIGQALAGILRQTVLPAEILILDDASTDASWPLIQEWQARHPGLIQAFRNERNLGALATMQKGLERSHQPLFYIHSADDLITETCFETYVRLLDAHPQAGLAASKVVKFQGTPDTWSEARDCWAGPEGYYGPERIAAEMRSRCFTSGQVMYRREMIEEAGGFRIELRGFCDWFWLNSTAFRHGIVFSPEVLTLFRLVPNSLGQQSNDPAELRRIAELILEILHLPENADLLPFFARSGALQVFGSAMAEVVLARPAWWTPTVFALVQQNLHAWAEYNESLRRDPSRAAGGGGDLEPRVAEAVLTCQQRGFGKVAIYGAGEVTEALLPLWERHGGPEVVQLFTTRASGRKQLAGHALGTLDSLDPAGFDAILLSSRTYEREMAAACRARFPEVPRIGLWHPAETSFLP